MVTWGFVHSVDVTCADWQVPFVISVVNTYASWRAEFAAEVCPTSASWRWGQLQSVLATERTKRRLCGGQRNPPCEGFGETDACVLNSSHFYEILGL